jgi:hypothetical protein
MSVREIAPIEWPGFLEAFSREHRAWLATVERLSPGGEEHVEAVERPLARVTPASGGSVRVRILIEFEDGAPPTRAVSVDGPAALRVDETSDGSARGLEIEDGRGERTRLRFRIPEPPGLLDGIAPAEL